MKWRYEKRGEDVDPLTTVYMTTRPGKRWHCSRIDKMHEIYKRAGVQIVYTATPTSLQTIDLSCRVRVLRCSFGVSAIDQHAPMTT